jgi:hypothetical protein
MFRLGLLVVLLISMGGSKKPTAAFGAYKNLTLKSFSY